MVISLESTEKSKSSTLENLGMEPTVKVTVIINKEIQGQMREVRKRNRGRILKTSKPRIKMRTKGRKMTVKKSNLTQLKIQRMVRIAMQIRKDKMRSRKFLLTQSIHCC